ncbi:MAG TPA: hypothetical protein VGD40_02220 [Chryseosolibacter sp.]
MCNVKTLFTSLLAISAFSAFSQSATIDILAGNGNGLRFWQSDMYKIHMGNTAEYQFGPVTDYSIKMNMNETAGRGWTWGIYGQTPIAALNNTGNFRVAGSVTVGSNLVLASVNGNKQIYTWEQTDQNWRIGMSATPGFTRALATTHVQYLTYHSLATQGFAVGVNGGESSFEVTGSHQAFFRGNVAMGGTTLNNEKLAINGAGQWHLRLKDTNGGADWRIGSSGTNCSQQLILNWKASNLRKARW